MARLNLRQAIKRADNATAIEEEITTFVRNSIVEAMCPPIPVVRGKIYLIRTVNLANVGKVKDIVGKFLILTGASWIANTGKFSDCLRKDDNFKEVEPFLDDVYINVDTIIDITPFSKKLPEYK